MNGTMDRAKRILDGERCTGKMVVRYDAGYIKDG